MKLNFSDEDRKRWDFFCHDILSKNERFTELLAEYLNRTPRLISARMVKNLARECSLSEDIAFRVLLASAIGLDILQNAEDKELEKQYLLPSLHRLDPKDWQRDAYLTTIDFPLALTGNWAFGTERYAPYEPFVCGLPKMTDTGREIPQLGYFTSSYSFPAVRENGIEWMAVKPNEIATMHEPIQKARGKTVAFGLGLGYFAFHASQKETVAEVVIVERDQAIIDLFSKYLLPQFPHREKIRLVQSDAFDFAEKKLPMENADFAFVDLWHDQSDGLPLYLRMRRLEILCSDTEFSYWIEPILLSALRGMVLDRITDDGPGEIYTFDEARTLLTDSYLRSLAPKIQKIE
ncbi:MAG: hypothetical protein E7680_03045 [Ruminococcaceae bacterium]|nr:hypothetical protein [Oscillospiraceae bacterium]